MLILASKSPWRKRLLRRHGISCRIHASAFREMAHHKNPRMLVSYNARGKAMDAAKYYKNAIVVGVDTVGVLYGKILGKPKNRKDAKRMLRALRGTSHRVITGLCVLHTGTRKKMEAVCTTKILFRKFSGAELAKYLDSNQWRGKAGSYAIQGRAKGFVEKIEGDVTNVVGLPVGILKRMLEKIMSCEKGME